MTARIRDLSVARGDRLAVEGVTADLPRGAVVGLVGPNGAGKTTLLRAVAGTLPIAAGSIEVDGSVSYMPQIGPAAWNFPISVLDVALQGAYRRIGWLRRVPRSERRRALAALEAVGMDGLARRQAGELSGGQRQRALLARTLVQGGDLVLLDEPLSGVDAATESLFAETLAELRTQGRTVLVSTHDLAWTAAHCDLLCLLSRKVYAFGPPAEALTGECLAAAYHGAVLEVGGVKVLAAEAHFH